MDNDEKEFEDWYKDQAIIELGCNKCYQQYHLKVPYVCNCECHKKEYTKIGWKYGSRLKRAKIVEMLEKMLKDNAGFYDNPESQTVENIIKIIKEMK